MKTKCLIIYRVRYVIVLWIFAQTLNLSAQDTVRLFRMDSLQHILSTTHSANDSLNALGKLVEINRQLPVEVSYLKQLLSVADRLDSFEVVYNSMANLSRYYYNQGNSDSLLYWALQIQTLSEQRKEYPDALFKAGSILCEEYLWQGNYELSMNEAVRSLNVAKRENHPFGLMRTNQDLGLVYQTIGRDSDAVVAFRESMQWMDKISITPMAKTLFLADILTSTLRLNLLDESKHLLEDYKESIDLLEQSSIEQGLPIPIHRYRKQLYTYYAELYIRQGELEFARKQLDKAADYIGLDTSDDYSSFLYYQILTMYYLKEGNHPAALSSVDKALKLGENEKLLSQKVEILRLLGRDTEALNLYKKVLKTKAEINGTAFQRQIDQLRLLNDLDGREERTHELARQAEQITIQQQRLITSVLFLVVLLVLLYVLGWYYRRARRLKNDLLCERNSLVESEKKLRVATEQAENANLEKTAFISDISHEIRTPLNAIVGFSELLLDEEYGEEDKKGFAGIISADTELLLNLVNDVLDLSRLESGKIKFSIKPVDIIACCQESVNTFSSRIAEGVKLTFTSPFDSYMLNMDPYRIQQVLSNLLSNAAKFTKEGEINLTIEINTDKQQVCLIVTDTGCGIPLDQQNKIFERFEKLNEFVQGTGLGLSICQIIAERLSGSIFIDPAYTKGARFVFTFALENND